MLWPRLSLARLFHLHLLHPQFLLRFFQMKLLEIYLIFLYRTRPRLLYLHGFRTIRRLLLLLLNVAPHLLQIPVSPLPLFPVGQHLVLLPLLVHRLLRLLCQVLRVILIKQLNLILIPLMKLVSQVLLMAYLVTCCWVLVLPSTLPLISVIAVKTNILFLMLVHLILNYNAITKSHS
nr:MAG: hypothetical protein 2 [Myotis brandtii picorna-like virus 1]